MRKNSRCAEKSRALFVENVVVADISASPAGTAVAPGAQVSTDRRARPVALILPSLVFWVMLAAIATVGGIVRQLWLVPMIGEMRGHQVGTLIVAAAFAGAIAVFVERMRLSPPEALAIGAAWLLGAIGFEFGFGHYVDGLSWRRLLSDYDLSEGRLLLLLWVVVGAGPFLLARWSHRRARPKHAA
jgi:hypothetical protein